MKTARAVDRKWIISLVATMFMGLLLSGCPVVGTFELEKPLEGDVFYTDSGMHEAELVWTDMQEDTLEVFFNNEEVTADLEWESGEATLPLTKASGKYLVAAQMTNTAGIPLWKKATYFITSETDEIVSSPMTYGFGCSFMNIGAAIPGLDVVKGQVETLFKLIDVEIDPAENFGHVSILISGSEDFVDRAREVGIDLALFSGDAHFTRLADPDNAMASEVHVEISPSAFVAQIRESLEDLEELYPEVAGQLPAGLLEQLEQLDVLPDFGFEMVVTVLPANAVGDALATAVVDLSGISAGGLSTATLPGVGDMVLFSANYVAG